MNVPRLIERAGERVLTTAQIAEAYGTDTATVKENFHRNKERYVEGKHFYLLTGEPLRKFKREVTNCNLAIPKNVNRYYLWTERGALLHAKSLNTDKAWAVYDFLVENYFRKKQSAEHITEAPDTTQLAKNLLHLRKLQTQTAIAEANARCARAEEAEFVVIHPELMPYANLIAQH